MMEISVFYENPDFIVINKPAGLASAPISPDDTENAFSKAAIIFPEVLKINGRKEIEHGLIHRLDTVTSGLILIARTQACYEELVKLQKENKIIKTYSATCSVLPQNPDELQGFPVWPQKTEFYENHTIKIESFFRAYGDGRKEVRPVTADSGKAALKKLEKKVLYSTKINIISLKNNKCTVECQITNGYRHQVRCHLAWIGLPIIGDNLYNYKYSQEQMYFCAKKIDVNGKIFELK